MSKKSYDNKSFSVNIYTQWILLKTVCESIQFSQHGVICQAHPEENKLKIKDRENNQQLQVLYTSNQNCISGYYKGKSCPELCTLQ